MLWQAIPLLPPEVDKLEAPPEDKRMRIIHSCDRLFAARINLTVYYVKNSKVERVPVTQTS